MTILDAAATLTRGGDLLPDGPKESAAVAGTAMAAEATLAMTARLAWSAVARPGSTPEPTRLKVPILESGADPGDSLHPGCPVIGYLRIDTSTLPDPTTWIRPIAYRVSAADHRRVPELPEGHLALVTRAARPPRPFEAFAIRAARGVGLCRVMWNGRTLLRLPEHGSSDFEVVDARDVHALRAHLVGPVVRLLPSREAQVRS
jgi:hypothetical protein